MRVFCPEHKRGFFTPRQNPIKCGNKGHTLGELDFAGEAKAPIGLQWQYCCNCEHFCPIQIDQKSLERCPVCTRRSSMLYLCDRCLTISFESDTSVQTKNFTLTSESTPQPSCPGCLQATSADLREHICEVLGASFISALNACPICRERLDLAPTFPSSVANYLRKTKTANKSNVTFDYETELFVPVEDGEFVLISNGNEGLQSIVLPRLERFVTRRDFYDFYQDYYHCTKPEAGEVNIIQPATIMLASGGWKLQAPGILEVLEEQSEKKAPAAAKRPHGETSPGAEPGLPVPAILAGSASTTCTHCGTVIETKYEYCWDCGYSLNPENDFSVARSQPMKNERSVTRSETTIPAAEYMAVDEEQTLGHDAPLVRAPIFSWALSKEPERSGPRNHAIPKLIAIVVVGLVVASLVLFVLTRSTSRMPSATATQPANPGVQSLPSQASTQEVKGGVTTATIPLRNAGTHPEDEELKKLSEKRITATASDRSAILEAFVKAENQYPNDFRFPYERARLATEQKSSSHAEAFNALTLAAVKAINSGKAHEMLDKLEADKAGDFRRLSRGHQEWLRLADALKGKDTKLLSGKRQL